MIVRARAVPINELGTHLRPASSIVKLCSDYPDVEVTITKAEWSMNLEGERVESKSNASINAKSIMSVVMLAWEKGAEAVIECRGPRAEELIHELSQIDECYFMYGKRCDDKPFLRIEVMETIDEEVQS